jgi:hypothetical protein
MSSGAGAIDRTPILLALFKEEAHGLSRRMKRRPRTSKKRHCGSPSADNCDCRPSSGYFGAYWARSWRRRSKWSCWPQTEARLRCSRDVAEAWHKRSALLERSGVCAFFLSKKISYL